MVVPILVSRLIGLQINRAAGIWNKLSHGSSFRVYRGTSGFPVKFAKASPQITLDSKMQGSEMISDLRPGQCLLE